MQENKLSKFMTISIRVQNSPDISEIKTFIDNAFNEIDPEDSKKFQDAGNSQSVDEWFSVEEMANYFNKGKLLEARTEKEELVGLAFIGMQNPVSWPDGKKTELFVLAVSPNHRKQGVGKSLLLKAEEIAKEIGSKKIIVNAHVFQEQTHKWYLKQGYKEMGILKDYYDNGDAKFFCKDLV